ncbi:MAG: hypothetical protein NWR72_05540 [Bacteroidia bacterium]|nr:hypothetical protein [Bacteroidia bacterium]
MKKRYLSIFLLSLGCFFSASAQGLVDGFMKGSGQVDAVLSYSFESYSQYYDGPIAVETPTLGTVRTQSTSLFLATGLTPFLDVMVNLPFVTTSPSQGYWPTQSDFQDISAAFRLLAFSRDWGKSGRLDLLLSGGIMAPMTNYVADAPVVIGHQARQLDSRGALQYRHPSGVFAMAQGGYLRRANIYVDRGYEVFVPDAYESVFRLGYANSNLYLCAWLHKRDTRSGTDLGYGVPFPTNKIDFTRIGIDAVVPIPGSEHFSAVLGTGLTLNGRNIGDANRISAGIVYRFSPWNGLFAKS